MVRRSRSEPFVLSRTGRAARRALATPTGSRRLRPTATPRSIRTRCPPAPPRKCRALVGVEETRTPVIAEVRRQQAPADIRVDRLSSHPETGGGFCGGHPGRGELGRGYIERGHIDLINVDDINLVNM